MSRGSLRRNIVRSPPRRGRCATAARPWRARRTAAAAAARPARSCRRATTRSRRSTAAAAGARRRAGDERVGQLEHPHVVAVIAATSLCLIFIVRIRSGNRSSRPGAKTDSTVANIDLHHFSVATLFLSVSAARSAPCCRPETKKARQKLAGLFTECDFQLKGQEVMRKKSHYLLIRRCYPFDKAPCNL